MDDVMHDGADLRVHLAHCRDGCDECRHHPVSASVARDFLRRAKEARDARPKTPDDYDC